MISFAPRRVIVQEKRRPTAVPATRAAMTPRKGLPVRALTATATKAPASMFPSSPMLTIPPWRLTSPPIAARRIEVEAGAAEVRMLPNESSMAEHPGEPPEEAEAAELDD